MSQRHYFMFTSGDHYEFRTHGVAVSTTPVAVEAWHDHLNKYQRALRARDWEEQGYASWSDFYDDGGVAKLDRWKARNDPIKTFMRQHRMTLLKVTDLHNGHD